MGRKAANKPFNRRNRKKELVLVFDENDRREFLTGFHKRKIQRKQRSAAKLQEKLKLEKKRIQAQTKLMYKKIMRSQKPIPEVSHLLTEEIDMGDHSVSVTEISALAKNQNWIGENQIRHKEGDDKNEASGITSENEIEGMEIFKTKGDRMKLNLKTKKDFNKAVKKEATEYLKKSIAFNTKSRVAQIRDSKRKRREEWKRQKLIKQRTKHKRKKLTTHVENI